MMTALLLLLLAIPTQSSTVLTFDDLLARVKSANAISSDAAEAMRQLETARVSLPNVRFETSASSAQNVDVFAQNVLHTNALTAVVSIDYPLLDGGARALYSRAATLDAAAFRQRVNVAAEDRYRDAVDAAAQLYLAQERLRILGAGLDRASALRERAQQLVQVREISNAIAAQWEEEALGADSQRVELELQRLDAETRVKQLIGETASDPIDIKLDLDHLPAARLSRATEVAEVRGERTRITAGEAEAARKPQVMLSAFGGVAALGGTYFNSDRQRYGLYGLRMSVALPMLDAASARRVAAAKLDAEEAEIDRRAAVDRAEREAASQSLATIALQKKIALLMQAVDIETQREASVVRLVGAGVRSDSDAAAAAIEKSRRENDLLAARVDLWRLAQTARR